MKVLFQGRLDLFKKRGGDTVQVEKTAEELRRLGVEVEIDSSWNKDLSEFDLVNIFQLDWICETYLQALNAKKQGKPIVLFPIHHSEREVRQFEDEARYSLRRVANIFFKSQESRDVLKNIYRSLFDLRKLYPTLLSIKDGYRWQQKQVIQMSAIILTQTNKEAEDLEADFGTSFRWRRIPLGVGNVFLNSNSKNWSDLKDYIVTVGRIEPRKNQLKIIEAVEKIRREKGLNLNLVIVGDLNSNNLEYYLRFLSGINKKDWITYVKKVDYNEMPSVYRQARVCVSASYFETTGLTLIEASISGCNVVVRDMDTGERLKEYLGDLPFFCSPSDVTSISRAIFDAYNSTPRLLPKSEMAKLTWSNVAKETLSVYNELLSER